MKTKICLMVNQNCEISDQTNVKPTKASEAFAAILNSVGDYGIWQWKLMIVAGLCGLIQGLQNLAAVFLAATPDHWCDIPTLGHNATFAKQIQYATTPWVKGQDGNMVLSYCTFFNTSSTFGELHHSTEIVQCSSWFYDTNIYKSTIVSEWNLVCDRRWLMSTTQSSFMLGVLVGSVIFSGLSDRWGRRPSALICAVIFSVFSILIPFTTSFWMFLLFRFLVAAAGQGLYLVNFILVMESVSLQGRNVLGSLFGFFFPSGFIIFSIIGYFVRDWRTLQICLSVPTLYLLTYFWLLPESPRWLMMQGQTKKALESLARIAKVNKKTMPTEKELKDNLAIIKREVQFENKSPMQKLMTMWKSIVILFRTPNMRRRNLVMFYAWFVVSAMYYGLTFSGENLNASIHLHVFISSLMTLLSKIIMLVIIVLWGKRRLTLFFSLTLGGIACLGIAFVPIHLVSLNIALSSIGQCLSSLSFGMLYFLSAELVPTNVRNISIGIASMWGRIGSIMSPYIIDLLGEVYYAIPTTIFGVTAVIAGFLVLILPETGNRTLPETVEEIEASPR